VATRGIRIGRLAVPAGFKVENYDYREGIVTRLVYQDGSRITLQSGGMYGMPLFKGAEYILICTEELPAKTVRVGRAANGTTCWREDNYRPKTANGKRISLLALFPPNVGYSRVPPVHRSDFDGALDLFIREIDGRPAAGPLRMTAISGKWTARQPSSGRQWNGTPLSRILFAR
jgi:hypothetical protein